MRFKVKNQSSLNIHSCIVVPEVISTTQDVIFRMKETKSFGKIMNAKDQLQIMF